MAGRDYFMADYKAARGPVLERDGHACVKCGFQRGLEVHHVNGYEDFARDNLRTLCYMCHCVAPMGDEYWRWEKSGVDGWANCVEFIIASAPGMAAANILASLREIEAYRSQFRTLDARVGRERKKASSGRCEGRKPYGELHGERLRLDFMRECRAGGKTLAEIADAMNRAGYLTRAGKTWSLGAIHKILSRTTSAST